MTCQRDQMASGKPYPRSCGDCGLGPCKKYAPYEYPVGFPESAKKQPPPSPSGASHDRHSPDVE